MQIPPLFFCPRPPTGIQLISKCGDDVVKELRCRKMKSVFTQNKN